MVCWLINYLSSVLLPFFVAWLLAYMLNPIVEFFQFRCRLRNRLLSIAVTLLVVLAVIVAVLLLTIPPTIAEFMKLKDVMVEYFSTLTLDGEFAHAVRRYVTRYTESNRWLTLIENDRVLDGIREGITRLWNIVYGTLEFVIGVFSAFVTLLYLFFILLDYDSLSKGWIKLVPKGSRAMCQTIAHDVKCGMNAYFRGQSMVAFCVGVLFSIGFLIIGFPMAVGLGMFIGLLNMVPYLQLLAFIPTVVLAMVQSAQTGENFWFVFLPAFAVFAVVQTIQDLYLTPKIMGKVMGLNPAIILLSLSVWGALLGFIGLIIALPLTTILISYYKQIIAHYDAIE